MTTTALPLPEHTGRRRLWLTTVLRPAGPMTKSGAAQFAGALRSASESSEVLVVDVRAVGPLPRRVRRALAEADARLNSAGGALLVMDGADSVPAHLFAAGS